MGALEYVASLLFALAAAFELTVRILRSSYIREWFAVAPKHRGLEEIADNTAFDFESTWKSSLKTFALNVGILTWIFCFLIIKFAEISIRHASLDLVPRLYLFFIAITLQGFLILSAMIGFVYCVFIFQEQAERLLKFLLQDERGTITHSISLSMIILGMAILTYTYFGK